MLDCGTMLAFGQNARPVDLVGAPAIGSDLSLGDKALQCRAQRRRFFDRIVAEVELEQIDPVRAESAQTVLAILPDVSQHGFAVPPGGPILLIYADAELGCDHDLRPPSGEGPTEDPLAPPGPVGSRCVEETYPEVEGAVDGMDGLGLVDDAAPHRSAIERPWPSDRPASEPKGADFDSAFA